MNFTILYNYNAAIKILEKDKPEHSFSSLPKDQKQLSYNLLPLVYSFKKQFSIGSHWPYKSKLDKFPP